MSVRASCQERAEIEELYLDYLEALDGGDLERWPALFVESGVYKVISRENVERGWALATMLCEGRGALEDRVQAVRETSFYVPRSLRHLLGPIRIRRVDDGWEVRASYAVFETLDQEPTRVFNVGEYRDRITRDRDHELRFAEKCCIYDSTLIPNSLIVPI